MAGCQFKIIIRLEGASFTSTHTQYHTHHNTPFQLVNTYNKIMIIMGSFSEYCYIGLYLLAGVIFSLAGSYYIPILASLLCKQDCFKPRLLGSNDQNGFALQPNCISCLKYEKYNVKPFLFIVD